MSLFGCKHPFAALIVYSAPEETGRDADFTKNRIALRCACGEKLYLRWASCIGGVDAFIERGFAAAGVTEAQGAGWCEHCGEGITDFCRGKLRLCPKGLPVLHRNAGVALPASRSIACEHQCAEEQVGGTRCKIVCGVVELPPMDASGVTEAQGLEPTDEQALAFHRALTDAAIGSDDLEDIKAGLRAVFAAGVDASEKGQQ